MDIFLSIDYKNIKTATWFGTVIGTIVGYTKTDKNMSTKIFNALQGSVYGSIGGILIANAPEVLVVLCVCVCYDGAIEYTENMLYKNTPLHNDNCHHYIPPPKNNCNIDKNGLKNCTNGIHSSVFM